jgi:drug/metabolite transporter (DMT)-like permease
MSGIETRSGLSPRLGTLLLLVLSLIWGLAFVAIRRAVFELTPANLTLLRWFIASGLLVVIALLLGRPKTPFERRDLPRLVLVALALVPGYHLALNYAETLISSGLAGLLISLAPVFSVVLSARFLQERLGRQLILALALALAGATTLALGNSDFSFVSLIGPLLVAVAAFMTAIFTVAAKPLVTKYGALVTTARASALGTVLSLPLLSRDFFADIATLSVVGWGAVVYLAIPSTVVGYTVYYRLIESKAVSALSVQLYLIPVVSVFGGILLLNEQVTVFTVGGGVLLLTAVALATRAKR